MIVIESQNQMEIESSEKTGSDLERDFDNGIMEIDNNLEFDSNGNIINYETSERNETEENEDIEEESPYSPSPPRQNFRLIERI